MVHNNSIGPTEEKLWKHVNIVLDDYEKLWMVAGSKFHPKFVCQLAEGYCVFWFLGFENHNRQVLK